jgi:hypothetical protein
VLASEDKGLKLEGDRVMVDQDDARAVMSAVAGPCEAIAGGDPCQHLAGYALSLEEEGPNGTRVLAARHVCAGHLAATADWALARPTPYAGEAEDVYLTLYERRVTVASLTSDGSPGGNLSIERDGHQQGVLPIT